MLAIKCHNCGLLIDETELQPGGEAHIKRFGPKSSQNNFHRTCLIG